MQISANIKSLFLMILCFSLFYFENCNNKSGQFESIIDEYITYNKILKERQYLVVNSNKWTDSTSIIVIKSKYFKKDRFNLTDDTFESSYKGLKIYFIGMTPFPISNNLNLNKIAAVLEEKNSESYRDYFDEIQIVYYPKGNCILKILGDSSNSEYFRKIFKKKGIMCN